MKIGGESVVGGQVTRYGELSLKSNAQIDAVQIWCNEDIRWWFSQVLSTGEESTFVLTLRATREKP